MIWKRGNVFIVEHETSHDVIALDDVMFVRATLKNEVWDALVVFRNGMQYSVLFSQKGWQMFKEELSDFSAEPSAAIP